MDREANYLRIPWDYAMWLGGLRWSAAGDAVEYPDGEAFALNPQVALFLEGLAEDGRLLHFGQVLHLLHLFGHGRCTRPPAASDLADRFVAGGYPLRNAGALSAYLCREVPPVPGPPRAKQVCGLLWSTQLMAELLLRWRVRAEEPAEVPSFGPAAFEAKFIKEWSGLSREECDHWLRHGCAPPGAAGEQLAREMPASQPRSLAEALDELARRERLAGAVPFVAQLVSVLALPPRRLAHQELPVGGYADVTTRGRPEQLLPSQFAVDDLEFVRRFAEHELLYFRREEPTRQVREELVVVLDQGVRTWGAVRLVLAAAVLALGKRAEKRRVPFRVACTSSADAALDPRFAEAEQLGELIEASDLTPQPGLALERVLEEPSDAARDVVLLTHPRSPLDPDVQAAARRAAPPTRLFALTVNDRGRAELAEVRHGTPVSLRQFQVDMGKAVEQTAKASEPVATDGWVGEVEPVGFPFRFGVQGASRLLFDFDESGEHLLVASNLGILHAFKLDGSQVEVLPRAMVNGQPFTAIDAVLGVAGGFTVCGRSGEALVVVHYEFPARCTVHVLDPTAGKWKTSWTWFYYREFHSVVVDDTDYTYGVDLTSGERSSSQGVQSRVNRACDRAAVEVVPQTHVLIYKEPLAEPCRPSLRVDQATGTVLVKAKNHWRPFTPLAEGRPALKSCAADGARLAGEVLALATHRQQDREQDRSLWLFQGPGGALIRRFPNHALRASFTLSRDGRLLARQLGQTQVDVHDVRAGGALVLTTAKGKSHQRLGVWLGARVLHVTVGRWHHFLHWAGNRLETRCTEGKEGGVTLKYPDMLGLVQATRAGLPPIVSYDKERFVAGAGQALGVAVDTFGQIALFDRSGVLLCMFFVFRHEVAAWMPDGTRFGPAGLTGGPETSAAREKIGLVLRRASELAEEARV